MPMDTGSEAVLQLRPVAFQYKKEIDPAGTAQFGLLAEEVEKVNPDLVVHDKKGNPYSVRYDQVNAMLLNEFLKDPRESRNKRTIQKQGATIVELQKQMQVVIVHSKEQDSQLQKVSNATKTNRPTLQRMVNDKIELSEAATKAGCAKTLDLTVCVNNTDWVTMLATDFPLLGDCQHCSPSKFAGAKLVECCVRFFQRERLRQRSNGDPRREFEKFVAVASGQICY